MENETIYFSQCIFMECIHFLHHIKKIFYSYKKQGQIQSLLADPVFLGTKNLCQFLVIFLASFIRSLYVLI